MDSNAEGARRTEARALALIERLDPEGLQVRQSVLVHRWPFRIGRSFEADMVLDDPHLAPLHAELDSVDGAARLVLGDSLNGAEVNGHQLTSGDAAVLRPAQTWRMGASAWRIRLASDALAPEKALGALQSMQRADNRSMPAWRKVLPVLLLLVLARLFERWLDNNPGTSASAYLTAGLGTAGLFMGWALFWSLGNKLFKGRLDFKVHLRLVLVYSLFWVVPDAVLPLLAYALDWPLLSRLSETTTVGVVCALIWAHLVWIMPTHRRGLVAGMVALYLTGVGLNTWFNHQRHGQYFRERYVTALPPPAWRMAGTQPVSALIDDARGMKANIDRQASENDDDEGAGAGGE
jgi:hypothetical protein